MAPYLATRRNVSPSSTLPRGGGRSSTAAPPVVGNIYNTYRTAPLYQQMNGEYHNNNNNNESSSANHQSQHQNRYQLPSGYNMEHQGKIIGARLGVERANANFFYFALQYPAFRFLLESMKASDLICSFTFQTHLIH